MTEDAAILDKILDVWSLPRAITPSEWTEKYRRMGRDSFVSRWSFDVAPYTRYPMDLAADPYVEWVVLCWAARTGKTQCVNNIIGWIIDRKPGNILYARENNMAIEEYVEDRFKTFVNENPEVKRHILGNWKVTANYVMFDRLTFYKAGVESPSGVVSRDVKYAFCDEVDLWPDSVSKINTSPIDEVWGRTKSYSGRGRKMYAYCTPTSSDRGIMKLVKQCGRVERWHAPCPHCGTWQTWGFSNLKWEPRPDNVSYEAWAQYIETSKNAWLACTYCGDEAVSVDHPNAIIERDRKIMMSKGVWVPDGSRLDPDTSEVYPPRVKERRVAFNLPALCSLLPGNATYELASEWLRACHVGPAAKIRCTNSVWAQPIETYKKHTTSDVLKKKTLSLEYDFGGQLPEGALCITAGIDTQDTSLYYTIRAWGADLHSWLIDCGHIESAEGIASDFKLLETTLLKTYTTVDGRQMRISMACIDSGGTRTHQVYSWSREWNAANPKIKVIPIKGQHGKTSSKLWFKGTPGGRTANKKKAYMKNVELIILYVWGYQDLLQSMIDTESVIWKTTLSTPDWYYYQMSNMQRDSNGAWTPTYENAPNHIRDCEVYALAAADLHDMQPLSLKSEQLSKHSQRVVRTTSSPALSRSPALDSRAVRQPRTIRPFRSY